MVLISFSIILRRVWGTVRTMRKDARFHYNSIVKPASAIAAHQSKHSTSVCTLLLRSG